MSLPLADSSLLTHFAPAERASEALLQEQINLWKQNVPLLHFAKAVPSGVLILNQNRQTVYANNAFLEMAGNQALNDVLGKRPGEILNCIHAFQTEGGCGTSLFCDRCGAVRAVLSSLRGEEDVQECRIIRKEKQDVLYLRVWASPIEIEGNIYSIFSVHDIQFEIENRKLVKDLEKMAMNDALTRIHNRRHFFQHATEEIERAKRYQHPLSLAIIDIDHFKKINDAYGHPVGDKVLIALAQQMRQSMRKIDLIARYGGEEFVILLPEVDLKEAEAAMERLRVDVSEMQVPTDKGLCHISISTGITAISNEIDYRDTNIDLLLQQADKALYSAKENGRNQVSVWNPTLQTDS